MSLTPRQAHIVQVIRDFSKRGYNPALTEIGAAVGIGTVYGVRYQIAALEKKGYLRRPPKKQARSIVLTDLGRLAPLKTAA